MPGILSEYLELCDAISLRRPIVVISDVDDTVTIPAGPDTDRSKINLVPGLLDTFIDIANAGGHVVIASARPLDVLEETFKSVPNIAFISNDGCVNKLGGEVTTFVAQPDFAAAKLAADAFVSDVNADAIAAGEAEPAKSKDMEYSWGIFIDASHTKYEAAYNLLAQHANDELTVKKHPMGLTLELIKKPGKKAAVELVLDRLKLDGPFVVYTGDAQNDVEAQQFVKGLGGLALKIASQKETLPDYVNAVLAGTKECARFYQDIGKLMAGDSTEGHIG